MPGWKIRTFENVAFSKLSDVEKYEVPNIGKDLKQMLAKTKTSTFQDVPILLTDRGAGIKFWI